jgi:hypothetical protein
MAKTEDSDHRPHNGRESDCALTNALAAITVIGGKHLW